MTEITNRIIMIGIYSSEIQISAHS